MKYTLSLLLVAGAVASAEHVILEPYAQCGGISYRGAWECPTGYVCRATGGTDAFPSYLCDLPGGTVTRAFPWNQCGGQGFVGPTLCTTGWECIFANTWHSQCLQKANTTTPANPDPNLATPGYYCGVTATDRGTPPDCVPGFTCTGPLTFGFYVCLPNPSTTTTTAAASTTAVYTTTLATTAKSTTTAKTTTAKTTTAKTTTTKTKTTKTTTTKKTTSTYKP